MAKEQEQPNAAATKAGGEPQMVEVGSPEFMAAVGVVVQSMQTPQKTIAVQAPAVVPITSIDQTKAGLDDLTVRFNRFCTFQNAGYQRGQEAGFPRAAAEDLHRSRTATITHDPRFGLGAAGAPLGARAA